MFQHSSLKTTLHALDLVEGGERIPQLAIFQLIEIPFASPSHVKSELNPAP